MESNHSENHSSSCDMDAAMRHIFQNCDVAGTNKVLVSILINFITPFMEDNAGNLITLKESLDPNNVDPEISSETFFNVMSDWAKEFNEEKSFHNISPRELNNPPLVESTPRASFGNRQQRVYTEAAALNISCVETSPVASESFFDKSVIEDHIKELTHQNKKYNEELLLTRTQLLSQEEANEMLQKEVELLTKDLNHERDINENLMRETTCLDELRECSFIMQNHIDKLKKQKTLIEKENQQFKDKVEILEIDKLKREEKIHNLHDLLTKNRAYVNELEAEVQSKDEKIISLEATTNDLLSKLRDLNDNLEVLQEEKDDIAKMLQDNVRRQSFNAKQSEYTSIIQTSRSRRHSHNTLPSASIQINDTKTATAINTPVPFVSPIKTNKFVFFNKDSPYAKRNMSPTTALAANENNKHLFPQNSPTTPPLDTSKPNMYVVVRSGDRKPDVSEIELEDTQYSSFDVSNTEMSLMDELAAIEIPHLSIPAHPPLCPTCNEYRTRLDDLSEQINSLTTENSSLRETELELSHQIKVLRAENVKHWQTIEVLESNLLSEKTKLVEFQTTTAQELNEMKLIIPKADATIEYIEQEIVVYKEENESLRLQITDLQETRIQQDNLLEEKLKEIVDLDSEIVTLKETLKNNVKVETPKKFSHERTQIQLEKYRQKVDDLEEMMKIERQKSSAQISNLQSTNDKLIEEKSVALIEHEEIKANVASFDVIKTSFIELLSKQNTLFYSISNYATYWKHLNLFDEQSQIVKCIDELKQVNVREENKDEIDVKTAMNHLDTIYLLMNALNAHFESYKQLKSLSKSGRLLTRPISPDSPSLEAVCASSAVGAAGDTNNSNIVTASGFHFDGDSTSFESLNDNSTDEPLDTLDKMYLIENLEYLLHNIRLEVTPMPELEAFIQEYTISFMIDCSGFKKRLRAQFDKLREVVTCLKQQFPTLHSVAAPKKTSGQMENIVQNLFSLSQLAERYGALQQEYKSSKTIHQLMTYITHLSKELDAYKARGPKSTKRLSSEIVFVDSMRSPGAQMVNEQQMTQQNNTQYRIGHLLSALGASCIIFYFLNDFFMSNQRGHDGEAICRNTLFNSLKRYLELMFPNWLAHGQPPPM